MERSRTQTRPADIVVGLLAGLVATQVTNFVQAPLQRTTPARVKRQERRVRLGDTTSLVAARKIAEYLDWSPNQARLTLLGQAIHFGVGMAWGSVYGLLRRHGGLGALSAGLGTGAAMSLILDEGVVPALGLSAPNRDNPLFTHVRGLVAHLVYGVVAAAVVESVDPLLRRRREKDA